MFEIQVIQAKAEPKKHWDPKRKKIQGPHSQILMTRGGGGGDRGSYFIPKKITTTEFVYPKI